MADLPFAQGFYVSESLPISAQECVNFYPQIPKTNTVTTKVLFGSAGLLSKAAAAANEFNRGSHVLSSILYEVNGENLYRIDKSVDAFGVASFTAVAVNGVVPVTGAERVQMSDNGTQMCIIAPESNAKFNAWIYVEGGGLTQISDADFDGPVSSVVYVDSFFMFTKKDGKKFFISETNNGLSYIATDFEDAQVDPDPIRAVFVLNNTPYVFGSETIEPYYNIGGSGFPYQRIQGGVLSKGIVAAGSLAQINSAMVWVGAGENENAAIWISNGKTPVKISTPAIDFAIQKFTDTQLAAAYSVTYSISGNTFVAFTFPDQTTFEYNGATGDWNERASTNLDKPIPWRVTSISQAYGELFVGDAISETIGIIDKETFTEFGSIQRARFVTPPFDNGGMPFSVDSIELVMESGKATTTGQGSDPEILMSYSKDGGNTWSNPIPRKIGKKGEYGTRIIWDQMGRVEREIMFKVEISDPIKRVVIKMEGNFDG